MRPNTAHKQCQVTYKEQVSPYRVEVGVDGWVLPTGPESVGFLLPPIWVLWVCEVGPPWIRRVPARPVDAQSD